MSRYPNLFLIGAPKCGTTSMAAHLAGHPRIFGPAIKEPGFFGQDLTIAPPRRGEADYLDLYAAWDDEPWALDASTIYSVSHDAAAEIAAISPDARIILMVRNPADACLSLYHQLRYDGKETLSFEASLAEETARARAPRVLKAGTFETMLYTRVFGFRATVERYEAAFGAGGVILSVFDDLKADAEAEVARVCAALDLAPPPQITAAPRNVAKRSRSALLRRFAVDPPPWAGRVAGLFLSRERRVALRQRLRRFNDIPAPYQPMKPETRAELVERFTPEIDWLETRLGRDLFHWRDV